MTKTEFLTNINKLLPDGAIIMTRDEIEQQRQEVADLKEHIKALDEQLSDLYHIGYESWDSGAEWAIQIIKCLLLQEHCNNNTITLTRDELMRDVVGYVKNILNNRYRG